MSGKPAEDKKPFEKTETSFASFKFGLLNTLNADRRLKPTCIKVMLPYLNHCNGPSKKVFKSIPDLMVESGLAEDTIRTARAKLIDHDYLERAGQTEMGVPMFYIRNPNWGAVTNAKLARADVVKALSTRKQARYRANTARKYGNPADMSPSRFEGSQCDVPPNSPGMSPPAFKGKYGSPITEGNSMEGDEPMGRVLSDDWYTSEELVSMGVQAAENNEVGRTPFHGEDEIAFSRPRDAGEIELLMNDIAAYYANLGISISPRIRATLSAMHRSGLLSPASVRRMVEQTQQGAGNAAA